MKTNIPKSKNKNNSKPSSMYPINLHEPSKHHHDPKF
jgi:hypothetical protein